MDKKQVSEFLNVSTRTVERCVAEGKLTVNYVNNKGVYDEEEVQKLKEEMQAPTQRATLLAPETSLLETLLNHPEASGALAAIRKYYEIMTLRQKTLLTIKEAAIVSGMSANSLRHKVKLGVVAGIKEGGKWKLSPSELDQYPTNKALLLPRDTGFKSSHQNL